MRRTLLFLAAWVLACGGSPPEPAPAVAETPAPVEAGPDAPQDAETAWMVIVAGDTREGNARGRLGALLEEGLPQVGSRPRVVHSDSVEGLKPGFWIVDAMTVDDEATAEAVAAGLRRSWEGTYVREVRVPSPERVRCPEDARCLPTEAPAWKAIVIFDITDGMTSEDWSFFTNDVKERAQAAGIEVVWGPDGGEGYGTSILVGGELVHTVDLEPFIGELVGYLFVMPGRAPLYQEHQPPEMVLEAAGVYFGEPIP